MIPSPMQWGVPWRWPWVCQLPRGLVLLFGVGWLSDAVLAQATFSTIFSNGPALNRINLVILSEGYTTAQLSNFLSDATNRVNDFLAEQPYQEYQRYFNCFAISVASAQSGSDHPSQNYYRDTYFNSTFDTEGIAALISIPPNPVDPDSNHGQGKVMALLQQFMPDFDLPILLVNDLLYGGGGGPVLTVSRSPSATEIIRHESGHTLGGLGDEYADPYPGYPDTEEPNTTQETQRALIKWKAWIANDTPVPTPATNTYANVVGLFAGAHYHPSGWYRPKLDCKMRTLGAPFCEVCRETLIEAIYARVSPIDSFSPAVTNLSLSGTEAMTFSVRPLQPLTHAIDMQWYTDGAVVISATGTDYSLPAASLASGRHLIQAVLQDHTPWVRTDPTSRLQRALTWTLDIGSSGLHLEPLGFSNSFPNAFAVEVLGTDSERFAIQTSTNLFDWYSLTTNQLAAGRFSWFDTNAQGLWRGFYRALSLP